MIDPTRQPIHRVLALRPCGGVVAWIAAITFVSACAGASQPREAAPGSGGISPSGTGTGSSTSTATSTDTSEASEQGNEAAEVAGAFLTCDYSGAEAPQADEADVGCMVKTQAGTRMDMPSGAMSASLDMGDGTASTAVPVAPSGDWHFTFPMAMTSMTKAVVTAHVAVGLLGGVDLTFALSELSGDVLASLPVAGYFDFAGVELTEALTAESYCDHSGRRDAVVTIQANPVGNPVTLPVGSFTTTPATLTFTGGETCFEPLGAYVGSEAGDLLAPEDANGRLIARVGGGAGGGASCFLAVAKLSDADGPAKALVVLEPGALDDGDVKRTAAAHACTN